MKKTVLTLLLVIAGLSGYSQNNLRPGIYYRNMNYYNPSATDMDSTQNFSFALYGRHKFTDNEKEIWDKPTSFLLTHVGHIGRSGSFYSLSYLSDRYSFFDRNAVSAGYGHQLKTSRTGILSFGVRAVINLDKIKWDKLGLVHQEAGNSSKLGPDLDAGLEYKNGGFTVGIAAKNLLAYATRLEGSKLLANKREATLNISYLIKIGNHFEIAPYTLVRKERNLSMDAGLHVSLFQRFDASYQLRVFELRGVYSVAVRLKNGLSVGIALDRSRLMPDHNLDGLIRYNF